MVDSPTPSVVHTASPEQAAQRPPLSGRVLVGVSLTGAALVAAVAATMWMWVNTTPWSGEQKATAHLEVVKVVAAVVAMLGGVWALYLNARRQRTQELQHAHTIRVHEHAVQVAERTQQHADRVATATEGDAAKRRVTELYTKAVEQLGSDKPAVRLGGLYALEQLGQENEDRRQTVLDVVCAYLRMPYVPPDSAVIDSCEPDSDDQRKVRAEHKERVQEREVRLTAQRIVAVHLYPGFGEEEPLPAFWGVVDGNLMDVDLTGATLIDLDMSGCMLAQARFNGADFIGATNFGGVSIGRVAEFVNVIIRGAADFSAASFSKGARFEGASFGGRADFTSVSFFQTTNFERASFAGVADLRSCVFYGRACFSGAAFYDDARFEEGVFRNDARFDGTNFVRLARFPATLFEGAARFGGAEFAGGAVFTSSKFVGETRFGGAIFFYETSFGGAEFRGKVSFGRAKFYGNADFDDANFRAEVRFDRAVFGGLTIFGANEGSASIRNSHAARFALSVSFDGARVRLDPDREQGWTWIDNTPMQSVWPEGWDVVERIDDAQLWGHPGRWGHMRALVRDKADKAERAAGVGE